MENDFSIIEHRNVDRLNKSLNKAKQYKDGTKEEQLAAILIYANHIEYATRNLLESLGKIIMVASYKEFNGVIFWPSKSKRIGSNATLGQMIKELGCFNFPDKDELIKNLEEFNGMRIKIIHKLLEVDELGENVMRDIDRVFDNVFTRYRTIRKELKERWPKSKE